MADIDHFKDYNDASGHLSATFASGAADHEVGEPIVDTVGRADRALYSAKTTGRDRVMRAQASVIAGAATPPAWSS